MVTTNRLHHHDASNGNSGHGSAHHGSSPVSSTEFSAPTKGKPQHQPHAHGTFHHSLYLILLLDGVGLAIIAACTILDGMEVWNDFFNEYFAENFAAMAFWFSGRSCQVMGLLLLIMYAATFQMFPELERCGMLMLTIGPVLNISSCSIFDNQIDNYFLYNRGWLISELVELIGIGILDISMIETLPEIYVLLAELVGFLVLMISATFDFEYTIDDDFPSLGIHFDIVHLSDVFGLFLLCIVAVGQYNIKDHTHMQNQKDMKDGLHGHTSPNPSITGRSASHANLSHAAEDKRSSDHIL